MRISDWSSDVCSSDLAWRRHARAHAAARQRLLDGGRRQDVEVARHLRDGAYVPRQRPALGSAALLLRRQVVWRRGRSEEHTSELQSLMRISYAVFCLKKKNNNKIKHNY